MASSPERLDASAREFQTIEVNNAFYRWPKDEVFAAWCNGHAVRNARRLRDLIGS